MEGYCMTDDGKVWNMKTKNEVKPHYLRRTLLLCSKENPYSLLFGCPIGWYIDIHPRYYALKIDGKIRQIQEKFIKDYII